MQDEKKEKKISIVKDGPYHVTGDVPVNLAFIVPDEDGNGVDWEKSAARPNPADHGKGVNLCRCGHSKTMPYCDGTHHEIGFRGGEKPETSTYLERADVIPGEAADLLDDKSLCVGARFCDVGEGVWNYIESSGDPDQLNMAIAEACMCPAGRLTVVQKDGTAIEPELPQEISAIQDPPNNCRGPLWVQGGITIEGPDGEQYETRNRVALCRCGESRNQPYCDGTHFNCRHMQGMDEPL